MCFPSDLPAVKQSFFEIAAFPAVVGGIDCTHMPIISLGGDDAEVYRNKKRYFSTNVQAICTADRIFTNVGARWPGSTHDSRIFENSNIRDKFENCEICGLLLGDSGHPCKQYLMTPLLHPANDSKRAFNRSHIGPYKNTGSLKTSVWSFEATLPLLAHSVKNWFSIAPLSPKPCWSLRVTLCTVK